MDLSRLLPEMSPALKRYYWRSVLPSLAFVLLTAARIPFLQATPAGPWRIALGLLPLIAWFWMLYEYIRFLRECDELERRIELGALVTAMGVSVSVAMALLFVLDVQPVVLDAQQIVALTAVVPIAVFAIARHVLHRRYR
jgi:hypothetical protein